ncbi:MAG TPA: hypothetical protein VF683_00265 [Chthoniobacterales bacterium]|jgi:hypothetical protein
MPHISRHLLRSILLAAALLLTSCARERVVLLEPKEDDLVVLNGCVISACNYLALVKAKHQLEPNFWTKILLVRYDDHSAGHAYCVWETEGTIYGYDRNSGGFPIPVYTRDPRAIAIVLAQQLSRIMKEPLSVRTAEFVDPENATLYKYAASSSEPAPLPTATAGPFRPITLSLADRSVRPRLWLGTAQPATE